MLIVCPSCASEYTIDPEKLGADGRTVRCAICRDTWFVAPGSGTSSAPPLAEAADQEALPVPAPKTPRSVLRPLALAAFGLAAALGALSWERRGPALPNPSGALQAVHRLIAGAHSATDGLTFRNVSAVLSGADADASLLVQGDIVNESQREIELPHLAILVRNGDEKVLATWTDAPPEPALGPGRVLRFSTRLPSPPPDGRQVRVQFTKAGGIAVAVHSPVH